MTWSLRKALRKALRNALRVLFHSQDAEPREASGQAPDTRDPLKRFSQILECVADTRTRQEKYRQFVGILQKIADNSWMFADKNVKVIVYDTQLCNGSARYFADIILSEHVFIKVIIYTLPNVYRTKVLFGDHDDLLELYSDVATCGKKIKYSQNLPAILVFDRFISRLIPGIPRNHGQKFADVCLIF